MFFMVMLGWMFMLMVLTFISYIYIYIFMEALKFSPMAFIVIIVIITIGFYGYYLDDGSYFSYDSISNICVNI